LITMRAIRCSIFRARALLVVLASWSATAGIAGATAVLTSTTVGAVHVSRPTEEATQPASAVRASGAGRVFLTTDEALALAFPKCEVLRETVYLTDAQKERVRVLAGSDLESGIARPWTARREGRIVGTAYLDTHKVRTLKETLFVVVDPEGRAARTEVLAFGEPQEYLPRAGWYEKFAGRPLDDELRVKRAIRPVTGASLTVAATTDAVRRVLALHKVLGEPKPKR
jgi:hypothetical protein